MVMSFVGMSFLKGGGEGQAANLSHLGTHESAVWCSAAIASDKELPVRVIGKTFEECGGSVF